MVIHNWTGLVVSLMGNNRIKLLTSTAPINKNPSQAELLRKAKFKQSFIDGIIQVNNCEFEWLDLEEGDVSGSATILSIEDVIDSYVLKEDSWGYTEDKRHMLDFRIVDNVSPEWQVGIFCGENASNSLYFLEDGIPYYLGLNMEGYIKMLIATRGYRFWQWALIDYKAGQVTSDVSVEIKVQLPKLFPEVKMEEVFALYDSLYFEEERVPGAE